jgi:hypothetical protein
MVSEIIGGMTQTTVKNENGARLAMPLLLSVEAQPIGRWHDGAGEQAIDLALVGNGGIEFEIVGHDVVAL